MSLQLGGTVIDQTGLTGEYDLTLKQAPDEMHGSMFKGPEPDRPAQGGQLFQIPQALRSLLRSTNNSA